MSCCWVLLLTDDPLIAMTTARLAASVGVEVRTEGEAHRGPPGLVMLDADRSAEAGLPPSAAGVPRILVATGAPQDRLWRVALEVRAEQVVLLPEGEEALHARLVRLAATPAPPGGLLVAVTGGCGGAGASVLAAALVRTAAGLARSLLIEVDRLGSGADLLLGAEDASGLRWPDLLSVRGRLLPGSLTGALPIVDGAHVLSWDRSADPTAELPAEACAAVLELARAEYGIVILDLPRQLDAAGALAARAADLGLLVVPAELRATAAARRVVAAHREYLADLRLVVRGPVPAGLGVGEMVDALGLPLAGLLRPEPGLRAALDRGEPPGVRRRGPLSAFCRDLLAGALAERRVAAGRIA